MQTFLHGRDFIGDLDFTKEEVETVLDVALGPEAQARAGRAARVSARQDAGDALLLHLHPHPRLVRGGHGAAGGHAAFIDSETTQISHGDTAKEIGEIFGRYFDGIAIRQCDWQFGNSYINEVAQASRVPVLNMQCDVYHPFQCLADLMTIIEKKGRDLRRKKMVVSWAYAASYSKPISVPQSLILQMPRFGMDVVLAHPPEFKLMPEIMEQAPGECAQVPRRLRDHRRHG